MVENFGFGTWMTGLLMLMLMLMFMEKKMHFLATHQGT
jgi:hypothetical protein